MQVTSPILAPVVVLVAWSMVMWLWMYVTRLPAMKAASMKPDPLAPRGEQMSTLPARVRWKADNYNHLMEQPTVFYAVALSLALLGQGDGINLTLAWTYVGIRVVHSVLQALINKIELRFVLFALSSLVLIGLTVNALRAVF
ncbi:MAPEG family protein [Alcanivorax sp.]|uniref:MAPEG family protein n=1 Tax=Alcanivorax sp. TaxID=1872427 RepID=UPI0025C6614D|nr:MAPEG family protein [Alcanivorax sp.]MEE3387091.1 MAPEG family protein [Pseudomonadota bacterium]